MRPRRALARAGGATYDWLPASVRDGVEMKAWSGEGLRYCNTTWDALHLRL